jgi:hypothetical protein
MSLIIGITGLHQDVEKNRQTIGAGKDAAAARLIEKHGFVRIGIADHIKRICRDVFDFTDAQLWGPSEERNKPDFRYPRGGKHGPASRDQLEALKQDLARLQREDGSHASGHDSKVKDLQRNITTWEAMAYLTPRYALQQLGTEWGRSCFDSVWIEDALRTASELLRGAHNYDECRGLVPSAPWTPGGVVFSDVRFGNEYSSIKQAGGKLVRVKRFSWKTFDKSVDVQHQSETEMLDYNDSMFDYIIDNGGDLHHLGLLVDRMMDTFTGRVIPYDESQKDIPPALRK